MNKTTTGFFAFLFMTALLGAYVIAASFANGTTWIKYGGNPLNLGSDISSPSVILDGSTYKMWYASSGDVYYATSLNGISWNVQGMVLQKGASNSWEAILEEPSVILDGSTYKMWYDCYSYVEQFGRIGYATSSDGISWTKYAGNPVLTPGGNGGWDDWNIFYPAVLKDGPTYKMWYGGQNYQYSPLRIGYATSSDGISWTKYAGNPVLTPGGNGGWDDSHVSAPSILKNGTAYAMWYTGSLPDMGQIGLATSADGVSWTKYAGNPVLSVGSSGAWDSVSVSAPSVLLDGETYKMWYVGQNGHSYGIGLAARAGPVQPVGGEWVAIDMLQLLTPWISQVLIIILVAVSFAYVRRKRSLG